MGQLGFFDLNRRYESLTEKNDPLVAIAAMVPFESFRPKLHTALINPRRGTVSLIRPKRYQCSLGAGVPEPARACRSVRRTCAMVVSNGGLPHL